MRRHAPLFVVVLHHQRVGPAQAQRRGASRSVGGGGRTLRRVTVEGKAGGRAPRRVAVERASRGYGLRRVRFHHEGRDASGGEAGRERLGGVEDRGGWRGGAAGAGSGGGRALVAGAGGGAGARAAGGAARSNRSNSSSLVRVAPRSSDTSSTTSSNSSRLPARRVDALLDGVLADVGVDVTGYGCPRRWLRAFGLALDRPGSTSGRSGRRRTPSCRLSPSPPASSERTSTRRSGCVRKRWRTWLALGRRQVAGVGSGRRA